MKLLVIGSTGRVGSEVVRQALDAGHHVTAFARDPAAVVARGDELAVVQGDVLDQDSIERALAGGHDAVISCLGPRNRRQHDLRTQGVGRILAAMQGTAAGRLVVFSAFGVGDSRAQLRRSAFFFGRVILPLFLARQFEDMAAMEELVRHSALDWVIVRPSALTEKPATGAVKAMVNATEKAGSSIPIADLASFMIACATSDSYVGTAPVIFA